MVQTVSPLDIQMYGTLDECIVVSDKGGVYDLHSPEQPTLYWKTLMLKTRGEKITTEKLNKALVKDLRTIAQDLEIPISKVEGGKTRNYLKNELKELIIAKLEQLTAS